MARLQTHLHITLILVIVALTLPFVNGDTNTDIFNMENRVVVTEQAMGARSAVAADFDMDGRMDIVSVSSNDNAVSWFRNEGPGGDGKPQFSIKKKITWSSLGSRIATVADIDGDGDMDVVGASFYNSSVHWFENDGQGKFEPHLISDTVHKVQGVTVADLDNDGDPDIVTASSGDNTVSVFKNLQNGTFCEIKEVVDSEAIGVRTVVAADLDGDGWIDLASASKDDNTVAWYRNDGTGHFPTKHIICQGNECQGAYSLVASDIDADGHLDLVVASNGNNHVSLLRNDGKGNFTKTLIYDDAWFVLSVTAVDFDRDGDMDVASASFFDGHINWYENIDGKGTVWKNHTIYVGIQGHYVSTADMDGDGDADLIAVTHAENTVAIFLAQTQCNSTIMRPECCPKSTEWNGTACDTCRLGTYGIGQGLEAVCIACPTDVFTIPGYDLLPPTCSGITGCVNVEASLAACSCPENTVRDTTTDACATCAEGQIRPQTADMIRKTDSLGNYALWEVEQGECYTQEDPDHTPLIISIVVFAILITVVITFVWKRQSSLANADALWTIDKKEITYDDPVQALGKGSFGEVLKGYYRGTTVAIKKTIPDKSNNGSKNGSGSWSWNCSKSGFSPKLIACNGVPSIGTTKASLTKSESTMSRDKSLDSINRKLFIKEMRILSKMRHPCITTTMGAILGKDPLLIMEYMENGSLRVLLNNKTFPLDPEQTLPLIRDVMQGLRFLHSADPPTIHGDLKCANILVDSNFRAKIADFGLSSRTNRAVGTPLWMAPELLMGGCISTQSDVYSFGILLWEVMTHKVPYEGLGMSPEVILSMISEGKLRPDCDHGLDKELVECMQDCWAQYPYERPNLEDLEMKLIPLCGQNLFLVMQERNQFSKKQSSLLQDVFPKHIAKALLAGQKVAPEHHDCVSIYYSDIVGFTNISSTLTAAEVSELLDRLYVQFDELAGKHGVFKLETIGDAWIGATNLTESQNDHAARISRFSKDAMCAAYKTLVHPKWPDTFVKIRVGFHSGPVVSSVVGTKNPRYCLFGDTMNTASRMESTSEELRIQCTEVAAKLAKEQDEDLHFQSRGKINIKGKGSVQTFWLLNEGITHGSNEDSGVWNLTMNDSTVKGRRASSFL